MLQQDVDRPFGMNSAKENGHEIWHKEFDIPTEVRFADGSWKGISKV